MKKYKEVIKRIDIQALKEVCLYYDRHTGTYPESKYQGRSLFFAFLDDLELDEGTQQKLRMGYNNELGEEDN